MILIPSRPSLVHRLFRCHPAEPAVRWGDVATCPGCGRPFMAIPRGEVCDRMRWTPADR